MLNPWWIQQDDNAVRGKEGGYYRVFLDGLSINSSWRMYTNGKSPMTDVDIYEDDYDKIVKKWSAVGTENFTKHDKIVEV